MPGLYDQFRFVRSIWFHLDRRENPLPLQLGIAAGERLLSLYTQMLTISPWRFVEAELLVPHGVEVLMDRPRAAALVAEVAGPSPSLGIRSLASTTTSFMITTHGLCHLIVPTITRFSVTEP